jgi:hypothetical protein
MLSGRKVVLLGIALVLAVAVSVWFIRDRSPKRPSTMRESAPGAPSGAMVPSMGATAKDMERLRYAMDLAREGGPAAQEKLAQAYAEWAPDPDAVDARAVALGALLNEPQLAKKLSLVLNAVNASKVPPEQDPLWHRLVESVATLFAGDNFDKGRDLMMMEQRSGPRRLLVDSMLELGGSDRLGQLTLTQRSNLLSDLIDLYHNRQTEPELKPQIVQTVRVLGGDDVATILGGADVKKGSKHPAIVEYERQLTEAERQLLPNSARSSH